MSLFNIFDIAGSGMSAQMVRLNTTASNISNADTVSSSVDQTYRARHPVFAAAMSEQMGRYGVGVEVKGVVESSAPLRQQYSPDHPMADERGYVYYPNVNVVEEMANMMSASRSYETNVQIINTSKQLMMKTLRLGSA
ncbi:MAG: flagellar basal body rod protein FlgC [Gammaproteobacteria bacterium]|nr:flagellar basal body rod protein FlgC [Gammaproteobacteria bacterium]MCF6230669.1 flagellar basal body rod protein FlgC [Gammaproteobacteria bacterium]